MTEVRSTTLSFPFEKLSDEERDAGPCSWNVRGLSTLADGEVGRRIRCPSTRGRTLILLLMDDDVFASDENGLSAPG